MLKGKRFEQDIEEYLIIRGNCSKGDPTAFDRELALDKDTRARYDQSGIIMYLDSDNWIKASMEYEMERSTALEFCNEMKTVKPKLVTRLR